MPNDIQKFLDTMDLSVVDEVGLKKTPGAVVAAGIDLVRALTTKNHGKKPQQIFTGIPDADMAISQAAGVAEISASRGVPMAEIMEFAGLLLGLGLAVI